MTGRAIKDKALARLRLRLLETYEQLTEHSAHLEQALATSSGNCVVARDSRYSIGAKSDRQYAASAISAVHYVDPDQTPDDTICAPGAISVTSEAIQIARDLNNIKTVELPKIRKAIKKNLAVAETTVTELTSSWLRKANMADIHRRQAHRRLIIFDREGPSRIAFSWCRARRVIRMTKEQAMSYLEKRCNDEWAQLHKDSIRKSRSPAFARIKGAPNFHLRANIQIGGTYKLHTTSLPVLIWDGLNFPVVATPPASPWEEGFVEAFKARNWAYLQDTPIVDQPRIYGYKKLRPKARSKRA
jgi:hypothetical protein